MKTKLIVMVATLSLIISLSFFVYAYLIDTDETDDLIYEVGNLKISTSGNLIEEKLRPGINIVGNEFSIKNLSDFDLDIRVKITFTLDDITLVYSHSIIEDNNIIETIDLDKTKFTLATNKNDYFEYSNSIEPNDTLVLFSELILDGWNVQSQYFNKGFDVLINIQVKQAAHASWTDIS